jgi:hypothetical protein
LQPTPILKKSCHRMIFGKTPACALDPPTFETSPMTSHPPELHS